MSLSPHSRTLSNTRPLGGLRTKYYDLVIGASGFIGTATTRELLAQGRPVRVLVRPTSKLPADLMDQTDVVRGDLGDRTVLANALQGIGHVYNCAGYSGDWGQWEAFETSNISNVAALLDAMQGTQSVTRLIHLSTVGVYGNKRDGTLDHTTRIPYRKSKIGGELLIDACSSSTPFSSVILRPGTVIGPGAKDWCIGLGKAVQTGQFVFMNHGRSAAGFVHVNDVARACVVLSTADLPRQSVFDVVDPEPISWRTYVAALANALDQPMPTRNLPPAIARSLAFIHEVLWRFIGKQTRPLLTRHLVDLFTYDRIFNSRTLRDATDGFPWSGAHAGLVETAEWLRAHDLTER